MPATLPLPLPMIGSLLCRAESLLQRVEPRLGGFGDVIAEKRSWIAERLVAAAQSEIPLPSEETFRWMAQTLASLAWTIDSLAYTGDEATAATASALAAELLAVHVIVAGPLRLRCSACRGGFWVVAMPMRCPKCRG